MVPLLAALLMLVPPDQRAQEVDVSAVLRRAGEYAASYHRELRAIVADEHYVQKVTGELEQERVLRSEFVMVRGIGREDMWLAFRDVLEVDGKAVGSSRGRLERMLRESGPSMVERSRALAKEQAKYNIGDIVRTINVPTLPLEFLHADQRRRFRFRTAGAATIGNVTCIVVAYEERERPTFIRTPDGEDVAAKGTFWIETATGRIWKTELRTGGRVQSTITVTYGLEPRLELLVPLQMDERYVGRESRISAAATYSNFRRFETDARIVR
jgi:hypothetical protein